MFLFSSKGIPPTKNNENEELKRLYHQILSYCRKNLIDTLSAEECTQEVFAVYFEKNSQVKIHNPRAWLYRTADNYLHRFNQKLQQEKQKTLSLPNREDDFDDMEGNLFVYEQDFDRFLEDGIDIEEDVEKVLSGLSDKEFELYDLHFRKHHSIQDLTLTYDLSVSAVKSKIYRLKQHILKLAQNIMLDESKD